MPLVHVTTSAEQPSADRAHALLRALSKSLAELTGKPESYVMTCLVPQASMTFGGSSEPACYVEVKSIGRMEPERTTKMSAALCRLLSEALGVPENRIYIGFEDVAADMWGFDGDTFG
jgi:phenylpyruvate tautomerase PptA (4-oxalocrotonate tautomerase family)